MYGRVQRNKAVNHTELQYKHSNDAVRLISSSSSNSFICCNSRSMQVLYNLRLTKTGSENQCPNIRFCNNQ